MRFLDLFGAYSMESWNVLGVLFCSVQGKTPRDLQRTGSLVSGPASNAPSPNRKCEPHANHSYSQESKEICSADFSVLLSV